ncbi:hypothetical protein D6817_02685 [Candidatus Pacearchaeota archaeon]|nr:MAG: hypothetical protein D6817_02685 [Candidatus Pacearchaeota archaeon]
MGALEFAIVMLFVLAMVFIFLAAFVFWLWMLIDSIKRDFKSDGEKIVWVLVIIFLHILGALIYLAVVYLPSKSEHKRRGRS